MFSVVIPAYNCEKTIVSALKSVLSQTRLDLIEEIIVVNDGSKDSTDSVIRKFIRASASSCPIRYFTQENHGVSYTRNRGIREAKADWIALLDSDDMWKPKLIERLSEEIMANPKIKLLGTRYPLRILLRKIDGLLKLTPKTICIRSTNDTTGTAFKRELAIKFGLFDESMSYCEDLEFFQKYLLEDGYYVLGEDLVAHDCWKTFTGQSGLSSHLREMHLGRNQCVKDLCGMGLISPTFMRLILAFNELKYIRRVGICTMQRLKYEILKGADVKTV